MEIKGGGVDGDGGDDSDEGYDDDGYDDDDGIYDDEYPMTKLTMVAWTPDRQETRQRLWGVFSSLPSASWGIREILPTSIQSNHNDNGDLKKKQ